MLTVEITWLIPAGNVPTIPEETNIRGDIGATGFAHGEMADVTIGRKI